jgi:Eukaryotic aspartyl protease
MAFPEMSAFDSLPLFDSMMTQKKLEKNIFSFYLKSEKSVLTIGNIDKSLYKGKINYHTVIHKFYWTINMDKILINGKETSLCKNCKAIIDTGTSLITGPTPKILLLQGTNNHS